jgi:cytochrome P450
MASFAQLQGQCLKLVAKLASQEVRSHSASAQAVQLSAATAFFLTGCLFVARPRECAEFLGLAIQSGDGLIEIVAFYGFMELAVAMFIGVAPTFWALLLALLFLTGCFLGRTVASALFLDAGLTSSGLHACIALAECVGAALCAAALQWESKAKSASDMASLSLTRRQIPNPEKLSDFVPYCAENLQNPYPWYKALREEAPIYKHPGLDYYIVSRAQDIANIARDTDTFSSNLVAILLQGSAGTSTLLKPKIFDNVGVVDVLALQDPPMHTAQRKIAFSGLTPKLFAGMEESIRAQTAQLLAACSSGGGQVVEFMDQVALRLPMIVALDLCGFPSDDKTARQVKAQADHGVSLLNTASTPDEFALHIAEASKLFTWIQARFKEHLSTSAAASTSDFSKALCDAVNAKVLSQAEAESIILQILLAGNDSSAATIGNAVHILCTRPDVQATQVRVSVRRALPQAHQGLRVQRRAVQEGRARHAALGLGEPG